MLKNLEEHGSLGPPGYAYGFKITFQQEELVLCSISHLTMKHCTSNQCIFATYEHAGFRACCTLLGCICVLAHIKKNRQKILDLLAFIHYLLQNNNIIIENSTIVKIWALMRWINAGLKSQLLRIRGKFSVNNKMNDFVGNILQNKFYACCYILLSGTCPNPDTHLFAALLCYLGATGAETSLLLTALNNPHPIHAAHS